MKENDPYEQGALFTFGEAELASGRPTRRPPKEDAGGAAQSDAEPQLWACADVPLEDLAPATHWPRAQGETFFKSPWVPEGASAQVEETPQRESSPRPAARRRQSASETSSRSELFEYETCNAPDLWEAKRAARRDPSSRKPQKSLKVRAIEALSRCEYTRKTLRAKLARTLSDDESPEKLDDVLDELERLGYLSDERYAIVRTRGKSAALGDQRLRRELVASGVKASVANAVISEETQPERIRCYRLWKRRFGELPRDAKEKDRQTRWLAYRGFGFSAISDVLRGRIELDEDGEPVD